MPEAFYKLVKTVTHWVGLRTAICLLFVSANSYAAMPEGFETSIGPRKYICPPCAHVADDIGEIFEHDGMCPVCGMNLIQQADVDAIDKVTISAGSGNFTISGGAAHKDKTIDVFYHRPINFTAQSRILLVIPGSGRNAWSYRDAWVKASEKFDLLILSPSYRQHDYDFAAYHMGGVVKNIAFDNLDQAEVEQTNRYRLKDEDIHLELITDRALWLFNDFDRIFDMVTEQTGSEQSDYDIFGHSAGGQILHRMALLQTSSKAHRIVAANSGFYTLPDNRRAPLFGVKGLLIEEQDLRAAFQRKLTLLVGEYDNQHETGGTMLHTPLADQQGLGRLARAEYFYRQGQQLADQLETEFNWQLEIVPKVGHDSRKMSKAAAMYLYSN